MYDFLAMPHGMLGIATVHAAMEAWSLNHWPAREDIKKKNAIKSISFFFLSFFHGYWAFRLA